jgi:hypothetical protein
MSKQHVLSTVGTASVKWLLLAYVPTPAGARLKEAGRGFTRSCATCASSSSILVSVTARASRIEARMLRTSCAWNNFSSTVVIGLTTVSSCASSSPLADSSAEDAAAGQARGGVPDGVGVRRVAEGVGAGGVPQRSLPTCCDHDRLRLAHRARDPHCAPWLTSNQKIGS